MADRDVEFDLIGRDKTGPGVTSAATKLKTLDKAAKDTQTGMTRALAHVESSFGKMRKRADDWAKSGDGIGRGFSGRVIGSMAGMGEKAAAIGARMSSSMSGALQAGGPAITGAIVASVAAAALTAGPLLGAALASGVLLGIGGAVLGAGIMAAAKSPAVQAAWKVFGDRAKAAFADFGKPFEGPLARAAGTFGDAMARMAPSINGMGKSLAPIIDKLAPALASMAEKALPGIARAAEQSKPVFDALAKVMPGLGTSIGKFFESIGQGAPGAALAIGDIVRVLGKIIEVIGWSIEGLSKMYAAWRSAADAVQMVVQQLVRVILDKLGLMVAGAAAAFGWIPGIGPKLKQAAEQFAAFATKVNNELAGIPRLVVVTIKTVRIQENYTGSNAALPGRGGGQTAFSRFSAWAPAQWAAGQSVAFVGAGGGSRVGGPAEVNVTNVVTLDGRPFREMVSKAVTESERRTGWRARVGRR